MGLVFVMPRIVMVAERAVSYTYCYVNNLSATLSKA
jgi:hypothetical protein